MTRFLRYLTEEVAGTFLVHSVTEVSDWFQFFDSILARHITEVDYKDQFSRIESNQVVHYMTEASQRTDAPMLRWRANELVWLVHKEHIRLDRAGKGL